MWKRRDRNRGSLPDSGGAPGDPPAWLAAPPANTAKSRPVIANLPGRRHEPADVGPRRMIDVRRAGSVTHLTLHVAQRLFGGTDPVPRRAPVPYDVARDASRLVVAMHIEEGLVG